jgi:hypothetical protein
MSDVKLREHVVDIIRRESALLDQNTANEIAKKILRYLEYDAALELSDNGWYDDDPEMINYLGLD